MSNLCFRRRTAGDTVQLVRHVYSPVRKRSATVNVGSVRLDADPDELPDGLRLAPAQALDERDVATLRAWLAIHGDPAARQRREQRELRIAARVRAELEAQATDRDSFVEAVVALHRAQEAMTLAANAQRAAGERPWHALREPYLAVYRAWGEFAEVAQAAGVAKTAKRRSTRAT